MSRTNTTSDFRNLAVAVGLLAGYALVPLAPVAFCCLCGAVWLLARTAERSVVRVAVVFVLVFLYAAAFLLNPVFAYLTATPDKIASPPVAVAVQLTIAGAGCLWLLVALRGFRGLWLKPFLPGWPFVALWVPLLLAVYLPSWGADVAFGGDECYHVWSVRVSQLLSYQILRHPVCGPAVILWGLAGVWLIWDLRRHRERARRLCLAWGIVGVLVLAGAAVRAYPLELLADGFVRGRVARYPAAQPWVSSLLGWVRPETWGPKALSYYVLRLLPLLSIFFLGLILGGDPRMRRTPAPVRALAVLAFATVPGVLYHGTILYLELPAVVLLCVVLFDSRRWLCAPYPKITKRVCWWAAILLGFTKDTAIVGLGLLWLAREIVQIVQWRRATAPERPGRFARDQVLSSVALLTPSFAFLLLRSHFGVRPHPLNFANLISLPLWGKGLAALAAQFGLLGLLAAWGVTASVRTRMYWRASLALFVAGGLWAMYLSDDAAYIGLARFNLLLLPSVLVLAWDGLVDVSKKATSAGIAAAVVLLGGNLLLSPVDVSGQRAVWGRSGECWYPFSECFAEIRRAALGSRTAGGNMAKYSIGIVFKRMGWKPWFTHVSRPPGADDAAYLRHVLATAAEKQYDFVVFRLPQPVAGPVASRTFRLVRMYPGTEGSLLLFQRVGSARQAPADGTSQPAQTPPP